MKHSRPEYKRPFDNRPPPDPNKTLAIIAIGTIIILAGHFTNIWLDRLLYPPTPPVKINTALPDICTAPPLPDQEKQTFVLSDETDFLYESLIINDVQENDFSTPQAPVTSTKTKIVLIIDDMGMDIKHSRAVIDLPADLTLAFLPYAPKTPELSQAAKAKGHELIIHVPMEAVDSTVSLGGMGLDTTMSDEAFDARLNEIFNSFTGYVGINNHMGSKLTQDETAMRKVMMALKTRGLYFIDSRTIHTSVADTVAAEVGIKHDIRDVFLDHVDTPEAVWKNLHKAEDVARKKGLAIVIGHPKDATINALRSWLPTLKSKNIEIIPASKAVH